MSEKKLTLEILDDINHQMRRFFFVMLVGAIFVGLVTWASFWWLGVESAMLWGVIAGVVQHRALRGSRPSCSPPPA